MRMLAVVCCCLLPTLAHSACPPLPDRAQERAALLAALAAAETSSLGQMAVNEMWSFWRKAPDEIAQEMLNGGIGAIRYGDLITAEAVLSDLVAYCPDYAEGYNQLAFAYYLRNDNDRAEVLLKKTLELEPKHFGALSLSFRR